MAASSNCVWYLTIDDASDYDHTANIEGLTAAATQRGQGLTVERHWLGDLPDLTPQQLDQQVFALMLAGSFPEWYTERDDPAWAAILDHLVRLIRGSSAPTLAVCGSHQAVARAFAGWDAVGHMVPHGQPPVRVSQELALPTPQNLIPDPRIGEFGTYPLLLTAQGDPLFAGLEGRPLHFTESHCDEVEGDARSKLFTALAQVAPALPAAELYPIDPADRCQVQALRLESDRRVLYTVQFHPELAAHPAFYQPENAALLAQARALGNDGNQLLLNFFDIAQKYWDTRG